MEYGIHPPEGYACMEEAWDRIGAALFGNRWDGRAETQDALDAQFWIVVDLIAAACAAGELTAAHEDPTGLKPVHAPYGPMRDVPHDEWEAADWKRNVFDAIGYEYLFIRRASLERYLAVLPPLPHLVSFAKTVRPAEPARKSRAGRKPKYDWVEAELFVSQRWEQWGDPCDDQNQRDGWRSDSDIAKHVLEHLAKLAPDTEPPDLSTVRKWLRPALADKRKFGRN
jgi:hypothetical protein